MDSAKAKYHHDPAVSRYLIPASTVLVTSSPCETRLEVAENQIICGDAVDVLAAIPSDSVDLVHTSPPYNIDRPYQSSATDKSSAENYEAFLCAAISEIKRVVRPGGSVFWQTGYTQSAGTPGEIVPIDMISYRIFRDDPNPFLLWDRIIWRYWGGHAFTKKFTNKHESILWFVKPGGQPTFAVDRIRERAKEYDKRNNFWGRNPGNVWDVDRVAFGSTEQTSHVAVFPEEVTERIVRACSEVGNLVLDPFTGSGTVPKVAHGLGRRWIGIEISPVYAYEAAVRVGFQQPSEPHSLMSELVKQVAFGGKRATLHVSEVTQRIRSWMAGVAVGSQWESFEADVQSVFSDGRGRNLTKRKVWMEYDARLENARSDDAVALADKLLCRCYKLRRHFNGVTRFKSALAALEAVAANIRDPIEAVSYITQVASQEPSSYELVRDTLNFVSPTRRITPAKAETADAHVPDRDTRNEENYQGRLRL